MLLPNETGGEGGGEWGGGEEGGGEWGGGEGQGRGRRVAGWGGGRSASSIKQSCCRIPLTRQVSQ